MRKNELTTYYKAATEKYKSGNTLSALQILEALSYSTIYYRTYNLPTNRLLLFARHLVKKTRPTVNKTRAKIHLAIVEMNLGKIETAHKILEHIPETNSLKIEKVIAKATILEKENQLKKALSELNKIKSFASHNEKFLNTIGNILEYARKYKSAMQYYNMALKNNPLSPMTNFNKARVYYHTERYERAIKYFKRALSLKNFMSLQDSWSVVDIYTYLGDTYFELKMYRNAQSTFEFVIRKYTERAEGYYFLAEFYYMIGKEYNAVTFINKAIQLSPPNIFFLERKATYLYYLYRTGAAIKTLSLAVKLENDNIRILDFLGKLYFTSGKYTKAIEIYKKRLKLKDNNHIKLILADAYFKHENFIKSLEWVNKYISAEQNNPKAYLLRAKINAASGYKKLAIDDLYHMLESGDNQHISIYDSDWYYLESLYESEDFKQIISRIEKKF